MLKQTELGATITRMQEIEKREFLLTKIPQKFQDANLKEWDLGEVGLSIDKSCEETPGLKVLHSQKNRDIWKKFLIDVIAGCRIAKTLGHSNTGGYLVPPIILPDLVKLATGTSLALKRCRIKPCYEGYETTVKHEESILTVAWVDEHGTITQSNAPTFGIGNSGENQKTSFKKLVGMVKSSDELLADADVVSVIHDQFLRAVGLELDNQVLNGTGAVCPGLLTAACGNSTILSGAFSTVTPANFTESIAKINEGNYKDLSIAVGRTQNHLLHSSSTKALNPVWDPIAKVNTLYGFPVDVCENISSTDGTSKPFAIVGNFKNFTLVDRGDLRIALNPFGANFAKAQVELRFSWRWGFALMDPAGFCRLMTAGV